MYQSPTRKGQKASINSQSRNTSHRQGLDEPNTKTPQRLRWDAG